MQRQMDLVRDIAFFFESADTGWINATSAGLRHRNGRPIAGMLPDIEGYEDEEILHTLEIMTDAGFIVPYEEHLGGSAGFPTTVLRRRLGWAGYEFLDGVRDADNYQRIKYVANRAKNWTFSFVLDVAKALALKSLGFWLATGQARATQVLRKGSRT